MDDIFIIEINSDTTRSHLLFPHGMPFGSNVVYRTSNHYEQYAIKRFEELKKESKEKIKVKIDGKEKSVDNPKRDCVYYIKLNR